jgi:hypothetical protein
MKNLFNELYNSRLAQYIMYGVVYMSLKKFAGFEFTVIICLTTILGEISYQYKNRNKF